MRRIFAGLLLLLFIILIGALFIRGFSHRKEIENYHATTVCKYVRCKKYPKTSSSYFKYYVKGKEYINKSGRCPKNGEEKINHFFIVHYSEINPNKIKVDFSEEVTDSLEIIRAGFVVKNSK